MRLLRSPSPINWRYAAGEFLLIVVGVLTALAASDWQGQRARRQTEEVLLTQIRSSLSQDATSLERVLVRAQSIERRMETLLSYLQSGAPYTDSLDGYFGTMYGTVPFQLNRAAYESLKYQDLALVSNPSLRSEIARLYEETYPAIEASRDVEQNVMFEVLRPYVLVNFRDIDFNRSATPLDYDFVARDVEFLNMVAYRRQLARQNLIPTYEFGASEIHELMESLELELSSR